MKMKPSDSGMYTLQDSKGWIAFTITTVLGDGYEENGWYGEGGTEIEAIQNLQDQMRAA